MVLEYLLLFSRPIMSDTLWPHGLQHTRPPCPSPSHGVCPSSCSLPQWCHPAISSSVALFSFCPQSFPASGTMSATHDQNTGASASPSVLPVNIPGWSPLRLTGLIFLLSKGLSGVFSNTTVWPKHWRTTQICPCPPSPSPVLLLHMWPTWYPQHHQPHICWRHADPWISHQT